MLSEIVVVDNGRVPDRFGIYLPSRKLTPQQRHQAQLLDELWREELDELFDRLQLRSGARVLVYDCGLGQDLPRLARRVAPHGEVVGVQPDPFLAHEARLAMRDHRGQGIRVVLGDPASDPIPDGLYEVIFVAWRLTELQAPPTQRASVRQLLHNLRPRLSPQGRVAVWEDRQAGVRLFPNLRSLQRAQKAWRQLQPNRAPLAPGLAQEFALCNILLESARPLQKAEIPGSPTDRWMDHWLQIQGPLWVKADIMTPAEWTQLQADWEGRRVNPGTLYFSPRAYSVVGRALPGFVA